MIPDPKGKTESVKSDPGDFARVLELELLQKQAAWLRTNARYRAMGALSLVLLFLIVTGSAVDAFFSLLNLERTASIAPSTNIDDEARGMKLCGIASSRRLRMPPELAH